MQQSLEAVEAKHKEELLKQVKNTHIVETANEPKARPRVSDSNWSKSVIPKAQKRRLWPNLLEKLTKKFEFKKLSVCFWDSVGHEVCLRP